MKTIEKYLENHHYKTQLDKLARNLRNKKVLIYGYGAMFQFIEAHYDLSKFNIKGVVDKKFSDSDNTIFPKSYASIKIEEIENIDYDCIVVAMEKFIFVLKDLENKTKKKVYPLIDKSFSELVRDVFYL